MERKGFGLIKNRFMKKKTFTLEIKPEHVPHGFGLAIGKAFFGSAPIPDGTDELTQSAKIEITWIEHEPLPQPTTVTGPFGVINLDEEE